MIVKRNIYTVLIFIALIYFSFNKNIGYRKTKYYETESAKIDHVELFSQMNECGSATRETKELEEYERDERKTWLICTISKHTTARYLLLLIYRQSC